MFSKSSYSCSLSIANYKIDTTMCTYYVSLGYRMFQRSNSLEWKPKIYLSKWCNILNESQKYYWSKWCNILNESQKYIDLSDVIYWMKAKKYIDLSDVIYAKKTKHLNYTSWFIFLEIVLYVYMPSLWICWSWTTRLPLYTIRYTH